MMFGGCCFAFSGIALLVLSDSEIAHWSVVLLYYAIHGAARGVWENTSKAVVADYFHAEKERETAYAAVYFTSGLAGAVGYATFQFMGRIPLAIVNTVVPIVALICYHMSYMLDRRSIVSGDSHQPGDQSGGLGATESDAVPDKDNHLYVMTVTQEDTLASMEDKEWHCHPQDLSLPTVGRSVPLHHTNNSTEEVYLDDIEDSDAEIELSLAL